MGQITQNPPEPAQRINARDFDTRSAAVEEWISNLPLGDVPGTHQLVMDALEGLQVTALSPRQRYKVLELFRDTIEYLSNALKQQLLGASFPLSPHESRTADSLQRLQLRVAEGYQLVSDELLVLDHFRQDFGLLTASIVRALHYFEQVLMTDHQVYRSTAPVLWRAIHQLYEAAERKGLQSTVINSVGRRNKSETTIETQYKLILLLALADPNRLSQSEMEVIHALMEQGASSCRLLMNTAIVEPSTAFCVDLAGDAPPFRPARDAPPPSATCRILDTSGLIDRLSATLRQPPPELPRQAATVSWKDLVEHLIIACGKPAKRRFSRTTSNSDSVDIVIGLNACHRLFNKEVLSTEAGIASFDRYIAPSRKKAGATDDIPSSNGVIIYRNILINESADGARLKWHHPNANKMRVGELLAVRLNHQAGQSWDIAVIRWLKTLEDQSVEFGIQLLVPDAIPVEIRHHGEYQSMPDYLKCLYLPEFRATRQPATLLVPATLYHADDVIVVKMDGHKHQVRLNRATENTQIFGRFQFTPIGGASSV